MIWPWQIKDRLTRWSVWGSYLIFALSVLSWRFDAAGRVLLWAIVLWVPLMVASMVKMWIDTRRDQRFHERVMKHLEEHGRLDGLPGEDQERLNISSARWKLRAPKRRE